MGDVLADQFETLGGTSAQTACLVHALTTQLDESQLVRLVFSAEPPPDLVDKVRAAAGTC
jgi:hypothetical protein